MALEDISGEQRERDASFNKIFEEEVCFVGNFLSFFHMDRSTSFYRSTYCTQCLSRKSILKLHLKSAMIIYKRALLTALTRVSNIYIYIYIFVHFPTV